MGWLSWTLNADVTSRGVSAPLILNLIQSWHHCCGGICFFGVAIIVQEVIVVAVIVSSSVLFLPLSKALQMLSLQLVCNLLSSTPIPFSQAPGTWPA